MPTKASRPDDTTGRARESRERMSQISEAGQVQCPNCGKDNPTRRVSSLNPRTRRRPTAPDPLGCLILLVIDWAIFLGVALAFWLLGIHPSDTLSGVVSVGAFIIDVFLAVPLYQALNRIGLIPTSTREEHLQRDGSSKERAY